MTPTLPAVSHPKPSIEVASPDSSASRHLNPGAASAAALTGPRARTKPRSWTLSIGAASRAAPSPRRVP
jgi:hypothetical protein